MLIFLLPLLSSLPLPRSNLPFRISYPVGNDFMVIEANAAALLDFWVVVEMNGPGSSSGDALALTRAIVHTDEPAGMIICPCRWVKDLNTIDLIALPFLTGVK